MKFAAVGRCGVPSVAVCRLTCRLVDVRERRSRQRLMLRSRSRRVPLRR